MSFQHKNISPYKDAQLYRDECCAIGFDDILNDDIPCNLHFKNGTKQDARGRGFATGDYKCSTLRQGLQFVACDLEWKLGVDTAAIWPSSLQLSSLTTGTAASVVEGKTYVHPSDGVIQVAGLGQETEVHSLSRSIGPVRMTGLLIAPEFFDDLDPELIKGFAPLRRLLEPGIQRFVLPEAKTLSTLVQCMRDMPYQGAMGTLYLESMAMAALVELAGQMSDPLPVMAQAERSKHRLAAEARARIEKAPSTIASPRALAHELGTNETTLRLCFKEVHGITLMGHVRNVRLNRARKEIRAGTQKISQVAYDCGYAHPANFTHAYRKRFGCTPREDWPHPK